MKNTVTNIYTFAHTAKKFGLSSTLNFYIEKYILGKKLLTFKPKGWAAPVYIRDKTSDWTVFQEVFFNRNYNIKIPFVPKVIVDCGANIGMVSLYFMQKYPGVKVIGVEPEQENYIQLEKNLNEYKNFTPVHGGVWNKSTYLEVVDTFNMGSWGFSCNELPNFKEGAVKAFSIEDIMIEHGIGEIDILKIDIEGTELEMFEENYESWLPKTKCIIIELHDWRRRGCSKVFFTTLYKYDFSIYTKGETIICYRND